MYDGLQTCHYPSVLMSIIFEHYKQLHQVESKIDRREREQVTSLNDWITEVDLRD